MIDPGGPKGSMRMTDTTWRSMSDSTRVEVLWRWVFRLALPPMAGLAGLLLYWIWFDDVYALGFWQVIGSLPLVVTLASVAFWTWDSWRPHGLGRSTFALLVCGAASACGHLNDAGSSAEMDIQVARASTQTWPTARESVPQAGGAEMRQR